MTMRFSSWGSPESARSFDSSREISRYSFLSWLENALVLDSSRGLLSKMEDGLDDPSVVLEESVKLDEITDCVYEDTDDTDA